MQANNVRSVSYSTITKVAPNSVFDHYTKFFNRVSLSCDGMSRRYCHKAAI